MTRPHVDAREMPVFEDDWCFEPDIPRWYLAWLRIPPTFDFNFECQYIWFAWWLITWTMDHKNQIDISISYFPD